MCMFVVAGRAATADGSVLMAYSNDYNGNNALHTIVVPRKEWPAGSACALAGGQTIAQPRATYGYTMLEAQSAPAEPQEGAYCEGGMNEHQVGVLFGTWANPYAPLVEAADPPAESGLGDELWSLILERCATAREGIDLAEELLNTYGSGEDCIGTLAIGDPTEVWVIEQAGGRHWAAARLPDDSYQIEVNTLKIRRVDLADREHYRGSPDLVTYAENLGLYDPAVDGEFDFAKAYGAMPTLTSKSNTQRLWWAERALTPSAGTDWADAYEQRQVFRRPDSPITPQMLMELMRGHFEGTEADLSNGYALGSPHYTQRCLCDGTTNYCAVWQMRESLPDGVGGLLRVAMSCPCGSVFVPHYVGSGETASEYRLGNTEYDPESAFWIFRRISNLLAGHYGQLIPAVRETWGPWEATRFAEQSAVEEAAVAAYKASPAAGRSYLTKYCTEMQRDAYRTGQALIGKLEVTVVGVGAALDFGLPDRDTL